MVDLSQRGQPVRLLTRRLPSEARSRPSSHRKSRSAGEVTIRALGDVTIIELNGSPEPSMVLGTLLGCRPGVGSPMFLQVVSVPATTARALRGALTRANAKGLEVVLVSDNPRTRRRLRRTLEGRPVFRSVGEALASATR